MPLVCYCPFVILTFCIWLSLFLCCYIALVSLSILQLPTHYINCTFIISLYMVKGVPVSVFFQSCFEVKLSIIFSPLHLVFLKKYINLFKLEVNYFTILYWFCHTSTWICHRYTRVPHPESPSHLPPRTIPLGHPSAPAPSILYHTSNLDWQFISYMILYMF